MFKSNDIKITSKTYRVNYTNCINLHLTLQIKQEQKKEIISNNK